MVAAVIVEAETQLGDVAAVFFVFLDDASGYIVFVKRHLALIAFEVDSVSRNIVVSQTSHPVQIGNKEQRTLHGADKTERVAFDEMVAILVKVFIRVEGAGFEAVEAEELEFLRIIVSKVKKQFGILDQIRHVGVKTEHARAFRVARNLHIELVVVSRIACAIAEVEEVDAGTVLEAQVAVEAHHGQRADVPARLDDFAFFVVGFLFLGFLWLVLRKSARSQQQGEH